jgi:hypothetical protein
MSFDDLVSRTAAIRQQPFVPLLTLSSITGPASALRRSPRIAKNDYLPSCGDCTSTTPCETECGWDPGKGGPVTCGEFGGVCQATCPSSYTYGEYWTGWSYYGAGNSGWSECFQTYSGISRLHNEWVTVYRRDRIRQTMNCPNAPSCDGCYVTEQAIGYQLLYDACYYETAYACSGGWMPCCSQLCNVYSWTLCDNDFPC